MPLPSEGKVIELPTPGAPDNLRVAIRPVVSPKPGEVLIRVRYAGVNGPDIAQRKGHYPPPPGASDILGLEVSGYVESIGEGVTGFAVRDAVCALTNGGGYAEYCAVNAAHCMPVPEPLTLLQAASLPETYCTIWSNIFMSAGLRSGQTFLVHGGAGGLGTTAVQLGKMIGATVVATDTPEQRCSFVETLGADRVINYAVEDFVEIVRREFGGADVILDVVGGDYFMRNLKAARHDGHIVQLAFARGSKVDVDLMPIMLKRLRYTGSTLRSRSDEQKSAICSALVENVWPYFGQGKLNPVVTHVFPLDSAAEAHCMMEAAGHVGKIMLAVE